MKRIHNSHKPIVGLTKTNNVIQKKYSKPRGFWYGMETAWIDWCKREMPHWIGGYNYELDIDNINLLKITNNQEIIQFHKKYKSGDDIFFIDWARGCERL